jgi:hypothetical protein
MLNILTGSPRPARDLRPAMPAGFDDVITTAMHRVTELRYPTARDFQTAIESLRDRHHRR